MLLDDTTLPPTAKLCDFGLSCLDVSPWVTSNDPVPQDTWPPEVLSWKNGLYTAAGDVWGFGLLLADVVARRRRSDFGAKFTASDWRRFHSWLEQVKMMSIPHVSSAWLFSLCSVFVGVWD